MAARRDICGARIRRAPHLPETHAVAEDGDVTLTPLGSAFMAALREDDRYRELLDDPFAQEPPPAE